MKKLLIILTLFFSFQALASDIENDYIIRLSSVPTNTRTKAYKILVGKRHEELFLKHIKDPWKAHRQLEHFLKIATTPKKIAAAKTLLLIFPE